MRKPRKSQLPLADWDDDLMTAEEVVEYVMLKSGCPRDVAEDWLAKHASELMVSWQ